MALRNAFEGVSTEATLSAVRGLLDRVLPVDITDRASRLLGFVAVANWPTTQAVSGTVDVGNLPATQPVSGTVAVSNTGRDVTDRPGRELGRVSVPAQSYDPNGSLVVTQRPRGAMTATLGPSGGFGSGGAAQIVAANPARLSLTLQNTTGVDVFIGYTAGLTTANGVRVPTGGSLSETIWTGPVWAVAASGGATRTLGAQEVSIA